jgi:hypothetical protein
MNIRLTNLSTYAKSTYIMLALTMVISLAAGLAYAAPLSPAEPKAVINPQSSEYNYTASPVFDIETGSNKYYKVELSLARKLFSSTADRKTSGESRNFFVSNWQECSDTLNVIAADGDESCKTTFTVNKDAWENLRGSVVFYRVITNSSESEIGALKSVPDDKWNDVNYNWPSLKRTGESWYGLPLNDRVQVYDKAENKNIYVVNNGKLNGAAINSDFGPRNVDSGTRFHPGLDFSVVKDTPVYAIADGKVSALPTGDMGRLNIKHLEGTTNEYLSGYVHLEKAVVSLNEEVKAGQLIAYSGNKGTNGYHLHFEAGFTDNDKYHNPLDYIPYTDIHTITSDLSTYTFLADSITHGNIIDVRNAAGNQDKVLIGFGITTGFDKDLNYVSVQVDESIENGWYFVLNYDEVKEDPQTGTVELNNGKKFEIKKVDYDIYGDQNLSSLFYVKAAETDTGYEAKDYFFMPWNVSTLKDEEDGGPHDIVVTLGEVGDVHVWRTLTIGPEIYVNSMDLDQTSVTYDLTVSNYDIPENGKGIIQLEVAGLPSGWSYSFSDANPSIEAGGSKTIQLALVAAPDAMSGDVMRENNTRVIATFGNIPTLKDNWVFCPSNVIETMSVAAASSNPIAASDEFCPPEPAEVTITEPTDNSNVRANTVNKVKVWAPGAAADALATLDVDDLTAGTYITLYDFSREYDTFTFDWPSAEDSHEYGLTATVDGFAKSSGTVTVTAVNKDVFFIYPTQASDVMGGKDTTVIVDAPYNATDVILEIFPADPMSGGDMSKAADGTWKFSGWVPSNNVEYYNLTATAYENGTQLAYDFIHVDTIPGLPTIDVPSPVKFGGTAIVTVNAPRAYSVTLWADGQITYEQDGDIWLIRWTPDREGDHLVWATAYYASSSYPSADTEQVKANVKDFQVIPLTINMNLTEGQVITNHYTIEVMVNGGNGDKHVLLDISGPESYQIVDRSAPFSFIWEPGKDGDYQVKVTAIDISNTDNQADKIVNVVRKSQGDPVTIDQINLANGQIIQNRHEIKIVANGGLGRLVADLKITGPETIEINGILIDKGIEDSLLKWIPRENGSYTVLVTVYDQLMPSNRTAVSRSVEVERNDVIEDGKWEQLSPSTSPGVKNAAMVDTGDGIYLFGGKRISGGNLSNKLWKWDGSNWIDQTPPSPSTWPEARSYPQLAYDSNRGRLVLFGGLKSDGTILRDVWEFTISSGTWVERTKYPIPHFTEWPSPTFLKEWSTAKGSARMIYDILRDRTLLLNSYSFLWNSEIGDWETSSAPDSDYATIGYDSGRQVAVLYRLGAHLEILEWDGSKWQEIPIPSDGLSPHPKQSKFISSPFGVYLIGGEGNTKELFIWDGNVWTKIHASQGKPPKTDYYGASVAYDSARNQLVVYTTNGQTWAYSSKLKNLVATPTLFTTRDGTDALYGPGMSLSWDPTTNTQATYYEIQFSEDNGATWQILNDQRDISYGGWINHHGNLDCGYGYKRCLKRIQTYSYRVRALNSDKKPLTSWSDVVSATSFDWPAHVEIEAQTPGPYQNGETVTLNLKNSYGQGMKVDWIISAWGGATATIVEGCGQGYNYKYLISQTCTLTISYQTALDIQGTAKLAALEPPTSVYVTVKGTDIWNNVSHSNRITLDFESGEEPPRITKVEPMLYPAEYEPGKKYGPGMRLEWIHSSHPDMAFYEIQFSEDGGTTWQVYMSARVDDYDWVNHHGNLQCGYGFYRCLKRNQVYHYRIRALDFEETPITDWSNVVSATSMEWPAHVEISATPPGPQYPSNSVVTLDLVNTFGSGLDIQWEIFPRGQAEFTILDNTCQNGSFLGHAKVQQCKLRIWVNAITGGSDDGGSMKLAAPLLAYNSVRVVVTGTDSLGFSWTDDIDLSFKPSNGDPIDK